VTRAEAIAKLYACASGVDDEEAHGDADDVLCELLATLGYGDVVEAWEAVQK